MDSLYPDKEGMGLDIVAGRHMSWAYKEGQDSRLAEVLCPEQICDTGVNEATKSLQR